MEVERRLETEVLDNKTGDSPNKPGACSMEFRGFCLQPFTIICVDPRGDISLCCNDTFVKQKMGSIESSTLREIWEGPAFQRYRDHLLAQSRKGLRLCETCDYYGVGARPEIIKKLVYRLTK